MAATDFCLLVVSCSITGSTFPTGKYLPTLVLLSRYPNSRDWKLPACKNHLKASREKVFIYIGKLYSKLKT